MTQAANKLEFQMMLIEAHIDKMVYMWKTVLRLCLDYVCVDFNACLMCVDSCGERRGFQTPDDQPNGKRYQLWRRPNGNGACGARIHLGDQRGQETRDVAQDHHREEQGKRKNPDGHHTTDFYRPGIQRTWDHPWIWDPQAQRFPLRDWLMEQNRP